MANSRDQVVRYGTWEIGGPRHYYREGLILNNLRRLLPSGRILDIGCGTGSLLTKLALHGYTVYGIDMSDECLRVSAERLNRLSPGSMAEVKRGSALEVDYPDRFFDAVIAAEVLEHLDEDKRAVREFSRLLRPGGLCIATVPANQHLWDKWDEMAGHKRRYSRGGIMKLFTDQSLSVERIFTWGFPVMRFYHRAVFLRWARHVEKKGGGTISCDNTASRIGLSRWTTLILGNLFRIDNIFGSLPWGIGTLIVARKG